MPTAGLVITMRPFRLFERTGRAAMDFGFSKFLERFEHHFGRRAEKFLVGVVGAAVIATGFSLLWAHIVSPAIQVFFSLPEPGSIWETANRYAAYTSMVFAVLFGIAIINLYIAAHRETKQVRDEVRKLKAEAVKTFKANDEPPHG